MVMTQIADTAMAGFDLRSEVTELLDQAFLTAYLLTRSEAMAERMVCLAIESLGAEQLRSRALIARTLSLCVELNGGAFNAESLGSGTLPLPEELKAVTELEPAMRRCFVARVLLGFSLRDCVALLQSDPVTITSNLLEATRRLCRRSENLKRYVSVCAGAPLALRGEQGDVSGARTPLGQR